MAARRAAARVAIVVAIVVVTVSGRTFSPRSRDSSSGGVSGTPIVVGEERPLAVTGIMDSRSE